MAFDPRRHLSRRIIAASTACFVAVASQVPLVPLLIIIVSQYDSATRTVADISWAASAFHAVSCFNLPAVAYLSLRQSASLLQTLFAAIAILFAILAALLSIYSFTQLWATIHQNSKHNDSSSTLTPLITAGFGMWAACVATQVIFYAIVLWPAPPSSRRDIESSGRDTDLSSSMASVKPDMTLQMAVLASHSRLDSEKRVGPASATPFADPVSPPPSERARQSLDSVFRPMASKTKHLLHRARDSCTLYSSRRPPLDIAGQEDDFGDWDTSGPNDIPQDIYVRSPPRSRLEPIPGSRPVSPAKPLQGPFDDEQDEQQEQQSNTTSQTSLIPSPIAHLYSASPPSETSSLRLSSRSLTSPQDNLEDIDHSKVHPLFRSDSPHPPPQHSTSTRIHGSKRAGEVWTDLPSPTPGSIRFNTAPGYRAESPDPLPPAKSRQGSVRSLRWAREDVPAMPRSASALSTAPEGYV